VKGTGRSDGLLFEDDGESWGYQNGNALWLEWKWPATRLYQSDDRATGDYRPAWKSLKVSLPAAKDVSF
jgi:alpha-glucosidase